MTKRRACAVVAIAKDEDPYILEWLGYHLAIGVDHVFVYDNGSRVPIASKLSAVAALKVTITPWPDVPGENAQLGAYAHYMRVYSHAYEWTAAIDVDEFIRLPRHERIADFLAGFGHANGIAINWRFFGGAEQERRGPGLVMERFTRCSVVHCEPSTGLKSIYRTAEIERLIHHCSITKGPRRVYTADGTQVPDAYEWALPAHADNFAIAQINHYFVKSREEWEVKKRRGYSWTVEDRDAHHRLYDLNDVEDRTILRWRGATRRWMAVISARRSTWARNLDRVCAPASRAVLRTSVQLFGPSLGLTGGLLAGRGERSCAYPRSNDPGGNMSTACP